MKKLIFILLELISLAMWAVFLTYPSKITTYTVIELTAVTCLLLIETLVIIANKKYKKIIFYSIRLFMLTLLFSNMPNILMFMEINHQVPIYCLVSLLTVTLIKGIYVLASKMKH